MSPTDGFEVDNTFLTCTSVRHLPLKKMNFLKRPFPAIEASNEEISKIISKVKQSLEANALRTAVNAKKRAADKGKDSVEQAILEILLSHDYRKGSAHNVSKPRMLKKIKKLVLEEEKIPLIAPLFACKAQNKLKSNGSLADFAELACISRLGEICTAVEKVYPKGAVFCIALDGLRFNSIWGVKRESVLQYQKSLRKAIKALGLGKKIKTVDYEKALCKRLSKHERLERKEIKKARIERYLAACKKFDFSNLEQGLNKLMEQEPGLGPKEESKQGQFLSIFRSTVYNIYFPKIYDAKNSDEETLNIFRKLYDIGNKKYGKQRKRVLQACLKASIKYIAEVETDRIYSPLKRISPNGIRYTIHPKPEQIGLMTMNNSTKIQSWHGTGYIDREGHLGCAFRIALETSGFLPVYNKNFMEGKKQPAFYLHPAHCKNGKIDKSLLEMIHLKR